MQKRRLVHEEYVPHKILVVDDEESIRRSIKRYLENHSFQVITADNGSDALALARESSPDLILSDVHMPGLDGHSLCRVLRTEPATKSVPLILMSGHEIEESNILAGFAGGGGGHSFKTGFLPGLSAGRHAGVRARESVKGTALGA